MTLCKTLQPGLRDKDVVSICDVEETPGGYCLASNLAVKCRVVCCYRRGKLARRVRHGAVQEVDATGDVEIDVGPGIGVEGIGPALFNQKIRRPSWVAGGRPAIDR